MLRHVGSRTKLTFAIPKLLCCPRTPLTLSISLYSKTSFSGLKYTREDFVLLGKYIPPCSDLKIATLLRKGRDFP